MRILNKISASILILIGAMAITISCNKKEDTILTPINTDITITMVHTIDGTPVEYDNIKYINAFGNQYSVARLQYFISDIILTRDDGNDVFIDEEFYVDGRISSSQVLDVSTKIPLGDYTALEFIFGLSEEKNVPGRFPNPPENNMEWPPALGSGYHYMKLEGKIDSSGTIKNYQAHTGPTFGNQNYIQVIIENVFFSISESETAVGIQMDINKWWQDPNIIDLNDMTMIMGNQDVQIKLHDNGMNVFCYEPIMYIQ